MKTKNIYRIMLLITIVICIIILGFEWTMHNIISFSSFLIGLYLGIICAYGRDEKPFKVQYKIITLKLRIGILKKSLKPYPSLNKIKHREYKCIREMVKKWRVELKELEKELKEFV